MTVPMKFRLRAFALHLLSSAAVLSMTLGALYAGWYRWPGWYLAHALPVVLVLIGVDAAIGPLLTLVVANPTKPARELRRDIAIIVAVQLVALFYGLFSLWHARPLLYTFSQDRLELVQAGDLDRQELALGRKQNPRLTPRWYSLPSWVCAPLPEDPKVQEAIVAAAITGGNDVIQMPRYFRDWSACLPTLKQQLKPVAEERVFNDKQRATLIQRMRQAGLQPQAANAIFLTGHATVPLLAVFDPQSMQLQKLLPAD